MKTVVIFHGFPDALSKSQYPLFLYFLKNKYRIIMPDLLSKEYAFGIDEIINKIKFLLKGKKPEVIVGISIGGLFAPHLAKQYPESKLILIGTVPYFKTKIPFYNLLIHLEARDNKLFLVKLLKSTPRWLYRFVYRFFNKNRVFTKQERKDRADENYNGVFGLPVKKVKEVLKFIVKTNNLKLLQQISNDTIIFAGRSDSLMPVRLLVKMNSLIKNSQLIISNRLHYDVFTEADHPYLDKFLN